jgi:Domain of unknown function (DUF4832)/Domain of unknown function (DUF4874)
LSVACGGGNETTATAVSDPIAVAQPSAEGPQVSTRFAPSLAALSNPERGWYDWDGTDFVQAVPDAAGAYGRGQRLLFAAVDIGAWRERDLPADWLARLDAHLAAVRGAGLKVVLRFAYDWSEAGNDTTPEWMARHLSQLAPVLDAQASAIAHLQAGLIGAWGEWHSSTHGLSYGYHSAPGVSEAQAADARARVRDALLAATPPSVPLQVRYPGDLMRWYPQAAQQRRIGLHNDCFLAGPDDTGTYDNEAARDYIRALSDQTGTGGETCAGAAPLRTRCADVLSEGRAYHLSYLNAGYYEGFIDSWRAEGCIDEVARSMGYRFQLDAVSHPSTAARGSRVRVLVDLRNIGWGRIQSARSLVVALRHIGSGVTLSGSAGDARDWPAQATGASRVSVDLALPAGAPTGDYAVQIGLPDVHAATASDARFAVRFANADVATAGQTHDTSSGRFNTGTRLRLR